MNSRTIGLVATASVVTLLLAPVAAPDQAQTEPSSDLAMGVRDLNRSMQEIASLLREQLKKQQADVLISVRRTNV